MTMTVDFLTVHFEHSAWTELLVDSIRSLVRDHRVHIDGIHIVDNSRDSWIKSRFRTDDGLIFHEFPVDQGQMAYYYHDHPASLSRGVEQSDADVLVILDCDAHIIDKSFVSYLAVKILDEGFDAIAAPDGRSPQYGLSHPCFLALTRAARRESLPFDSRVLNSQADVGRLIGSFLTDKGMRVHVPERTKTFAGACGELFDGQIYHHGSGTFLHSTSKEVNKQVHQYARLFENAVLRHRRFQLSFWERWYVRIHSRLPRFPCRR